MPLFSRLRFALLLLVALVIVPHGAQCQTERISSNIVILGHVNACTIGPTGTTGNAYVCSLDIAIQDASAPGLLWFRSRCGQHWSGFA